MIKKTLLLLFTFLATVAMAQEKKLTLHLNDGTTQDFLVSTIDSITFSEVQQSGPALVLEYTVNDGDENRLPLDGRLDCTVDYGDGTTDEFHENFSASSSDYKAHVYEKAGTYEVRIAGGVEHLYSGLGHTNDSRLLLTAIKSWGNLEGLTSMESAFRSCKGLLSVPADNNGAFKNVTSFKQAFEYCTKLKEIPSSLFAGCQAATTLYGCFANCESLTALPDTLFYPLVNVTDFSSVMNWCSALKTLPEGLFAKNTNAENFGNAFCFSGLESIPAKLFSGLRNAKDFNCVFQACRKLTAIPDSLFAGCTSATNFSTAFWGNWNVTTIGKDVFQGCVAAANFKWLFNGCEKLESVPANIFDDCKEVTNFSGTFKDCKALACESPYTMVDDTKVHIYERQNYKWDFTKPTTFNECFANATLLTDYNTISTDYSDWTK